MSFCNYIYECEKCENETVYPVPIYESHFNDVTIHCSQPRKEDIKCLNPNCK